MKRGILVATLMVTAAGVAGVNLLTAASSGPAAAAAHSETRIREVAPAVAIRVAEPAPVVAVPAAAPAAKPPVPTVQTAQAVQKASVEARQAPVPLLMKPRPPVNVPAADANDAKTDAAKPGESPADQMAAADGFNENAARAAIEADGYKSVKVLRKGANGAWQATALRGKTPVTLTVDASGSVSAD